MQQLEELDQAAQRSVAAEVESAVESQLGQAAYLVDDAGRQRILEICEKVRKSCARIDDAEKKFRLQQELQKTATGQQEWQTSAAEPAVSSSSGTIPHLRQPRGSTPLSYWDWRIWTMARPTLWRFGDAGNLYPDRETPLTLLEWMCYVLLREEMEYDLPSDKAKFTVRSGDTGPEHQPLRRRLGDAPYSLFSTRPGFAARV